MRIIGTHHVGMSTSNLDRLREFYVGVLDLRPAGGFPNENIAFVNAGTALVELVGEAIGNPDRRKSGWNHLALEVQDVDETFAELSARGIAFDVSPEDFPPNEPKFRIAFLRDPDGNQIELIQALGLPMGRDRPTHPSDRRPIRSKKSVISPDVSTDWVCRRGRNRNPKNPPSLAGVGLSNAVNQC